MCLGTVRGFALFPSTTKGCDAGYMPDGIATDIQKGRAARSRSPVGADIHADHLRFRLDGMHEAVDHAFAEVATPPLGIAEEVGVVPWPHVGIHGKPWKAHCPCSNDGGVEGSLCGKHLQDGIDPAMVIHGHQVPLRYLRAGVCNHVVTRGGNATLGNHIATRQVQVPVGAFVA